MIHVEIKTNDPQRRRLLYQGRAAQKHTGLPQNLRGRELVHQLTDLAPGRVNRRRHRSDLAASVDAADLRRRTEWVPLDGRLPGPDRR